MPSANEIQDLLGQAGSSVARTQSVNKNINKPNANTNPDLKKQKSDGLSQFASELFPTSTKTKKKVKVGGTKRVGGSFIESAMSEIEEGQAREKILKPLASAKIGPPSPSDARKKSVFDKGFIEPETSTDLIKTVGRESAKFRQKTGLGKGVLGKRVRRAAQPSQQDIASLKPGESIGNFSIAKTPIGGTKRKGVPGSIADINQLFGSAAELAKIFTSKEFQERKAKGIRASAALTGQRADTKALTDTVKAEGALLKDLIESGADPSLISKVQERLQRRFQEGGGSSENQEQLLGIDRELNRG